MKTFNQTSNVIMLHHLLNGMLNVFEIPFTEWHETPDHDRNELYVMQEAALKDEIDEWYDSFSRRFPFGKHSWTQLNLAERDLVELAFEQCNVLTALYGELERQ